MAKGQKNRDPPLDASPKPEFWKLLSLSLWKELYHDFIYFPTQSMFTVTLFCLS